MKKSLKDVLDVLHKSNYIKTELIGNKFKILNMQQLGSILLNNIKEEWKQTKSSINTYLMENNNEMDSNTNQENDSTSYFKSHKFRDNLLHIKATFQKEYPLAIQEIITLKDHKEKDFIDQTSIKAEHDDPNKNNVDLVQINFPNTISLKCYYFFNEFNAIEQFYKIQRERKIWWMKFSTNPGRINLADLKTDNLQKTVKIKSQFQFGDIELEEIQLIPLKILNLEKPFDYYLKDIRLNKKTLPVIVKSEINLNTACLGIMFDAIYESRNSKICLNRKIAPYQCSIFCVAEDENSLLELGDLAQHLTNVVRRFNIKILNLNKCYTNNEKTLNNELLQMDKIGVPYSIILEEDTLKNGLMKLRNRDTTLSEVIHVTDVPNYLMKIFNS